MRVRAASIWFPLTTRKDEILAVWTSFIGASTTEAPAFKLETHYWGPKCDQMVHGLWVIDRTNEAGWMDSLDGLEFARTISWSEFLDAYSTWCDRIGVPRMEFADTGFRRATWAVIR